MLLSLASYIIVCNEPRWLRDMLARVLDKVAGLHAHTGRADTARLHTLVRNEHPDWVIMTLGADGELPPEAQSLTAEQPSLGIVGIAPDGGGVKLQRHGFISDSIPDLSLDELIALLWPGDSGRAPAEAA
jgi:hypothetical protein